MTASSADTREFSPAELAVTPDGQVVYAVTKHYDYVYKLIEGQSPQILAFYGEPLADCRPGKALSTDAQGQVLFVNRQDRYLYRLTADRVHALYLERRAAQYFTMPTPYEPAKHASFSEPTFLQREGSWLYLQVNAPGEQLIRRMHLESYDVEEVFHRFLQDLLTYPYSIKANYLYRLQGVGSELKLHRIVLGSKDIQHPEDLPLDLADAARRLRILPLAMLSGPSDLLYISDSRSHGIWRIRIGTIGSPSELRLLAGCGEAGYRDGKGTDACFAMPASLSLDAAGNLYVADAWNHAIRKVSPEGDVSTIFKSEK